MQKILWVLLVCSVLYCLRDAWNRYRLESANHSVEIVLDYDGFLDFCRKEGFPVGSMLSRFRQLGVASIAPSETTLDKLRQSGKLVWISGADLPLFESDTEWAKIRHQVSAEKLPFIIVKVKDPQLRHWLLDAFSGLFEKEQYRLLSDGFVVRGKPDDLTQLGLGIDGSQIAPLAELGFSVDPRVTNRDDINLRRIRYLLDNLSSLPKVSTVIFSGLRNEVLGYEHEIPTVGKLLTAHRIRFGYVEAYESDRALRGSLELARLLPDSVIKAQGLIIPAFGRIDPGKGADTFLLGVRERNVRMVYFRPFLINDGGRSLLDNNVDFLTELGMRLRQSGFSIGRAKAFRMFQPSRTTIVVSSLGLAVGSLLLLSFFINLSWGGVLECLTATLLLLLIGFHFGGLGIIRSGFAFLEACVFPVFGIVVASQARPQRFAKSVLALGLATILTLSGGILVSALLADNLTLLGIESFHGVKALLVFPVLLAPWLAWVYHSKNGRFENLRQCLARSLEPLRQPIRASHAMALIFLAGIGLVIVLRSGNAVPEGAVPEWEKGFRNFLETFLVARPRFKEFLIGHPFFMLSCALGLENRWAAFFLLLGTLGQVDIMDSFAHLHTPLRLTLIRTFNGLWIGILFAWILRIVALKIQRTLHDEF